MAWYPARFAHIALRFLPFLLAYLRDRHRFVVVGRSRRVTGDQRQVRAVEMRDTMLDLGPTFIKIGQVLSTRPDVVPEVYAEEFATLQDAVPPGPFGEIEPTIADDVGTDAYEAFDTEALAGGSLAQVYEARYEGRRVAVKVRRPGIVDLIETDLGVIRRLLPVAVAVAPRQHRFSLRNMADDFERIIREELDFDREGRMMDEIRGNFAEDESVRIPRWYSEVSSERVLTMEYVESIKITEVERLRAAGFDPKEIAHEVANAYFKMGIEDGVFHGDPHPGNLGVDERGRVVFYDFGMSGRFSPRMQQAIVDLYLATVARDVDRIMDVLVDLGALDPDVDRRAMAHVLDLVIDDLEGRGVSDWRMILSEAITVLRDFPFRIPPDLMLVIRVGTVSEGVLRQLDPEFDFIAAARQFLRSHGYLGRGARAFLSEARGDVSASARAALRIPASVEDTLETITEGEIRVDIDLLRALTAVSRPLAFALITSAWVVGSAILTQVAPVFGAIGFAIATVMTLIFLLTLRRARREEDFRSRR
ncbi:MAG: ABC1 kinase family protein [Halobacteriota archaeon]